MNKTLLLIGALAIAALMTPLLMQIQDVFADGNNDDKGKDAGKGNPQQGKKSCGNGSSSANNPHCK